MSASGPSLCENSDIVLENRNCVSISKMRKPAVLSMSIWRTQQRKPCSTDLVFIQPGPKASPLVRIIPNRRTGHSDSSNGDESQFKKWKKWDGLWLTLPSPAGLIYIKLPEQKRVGEWLETLLSARTETLLPSNARASSSAVGF